MNVAGANLPRNVARAIQILRLHIARQSIRCVVGDTHCIRIVFVADDGQHRPEDFFARNRHVVSDVGEHGGLHEVAVVQAFGQTFTAAFQLRAFFNALLDQALNLVPLGFGYHRTCTGIGLGRITHFHFQCGSLGDGSGFVHALVRHEHACGRIAGLPAVECARSHAGSDDLREIRIVEHDVCGLAAKFLRYTLHGRRSVLRNQNARAG